MVRVRVRPLALAQVPGRCCSLPMRRARGVENLRGGDSPQAANLKQGRCGGAAVVRWCGGAGAGLWESVAIVW